VKYWRSATGYPVKAQITLDGEVFHRGAHSIFAGVTDPGGNAWDVQLSQRNMVLQGGTTYHASFMAKSPVAQDQISAAVINSSNFALAGQKTISPDETWELYEFDFTPSETFAASFNVDMGGHTGSYYLDDFVLTTGELNDLNLVKNPDFFDQEEFWILNNLSSALSEGAVVDGEYAVSITNGGASAWDIHLGQPGLPVENGFEYLVSFDAYASAPRQISALVGKNGEPWTVYSKEEPISLTTTKQNYSFTFTMNEPTDLQSRLGFDMGGNGANVYFDNILLRKVQAVGTASKFSVTPLQALASLRNYPNPVRSETTFYYVLQEPSLVSLRVFNLHGEEVETIENGFRQKGEHFVRWEPGELPAGIYLYQLCVGEMSETGKLILIRK
jgi:hypothetical protein